MQDTARLTLLFSLLPIVAGSPAMAETVKVQGTWCRKGSAGAFLGGGGVGGGGGWGGRSPNVAGQKLQIAEVVHPASFSYPPFLRADLEEEAGGTTAGTAFGGSGKPKAPKSAWEGEAKFLM